MKLLFIYPNMAVYGGLERVWVDKANLLSRLYDYDVCILTYNQGSHVVPYQQDERVNHIDLDVRTHRKYNYTGFRRLYQGLHLQRLLRQRIMETIRRLQPDVIVMSTIEELSFLLKNMTKRPWSLNLIMDTIISVSPLV